MLTFFYILPFHYYNLVSVHYIIVPLFSVRPIILVNLTLILRCYICMGCWTKDNPFTPKYIVQEQQHALKV